VGAAWKSGGARPAGGPSGRREVRHAGWWWPRDDGSRPPPLGRHNDGGASGAPPGGRRREWLRRSRRGLGRRKPGSRQATGHHAVVAACNAWSSSPLRVVVIASGDLIRIEGIICIVQWQPGSIPSRGIEPERQFPPFQDEGRRRWEAQSLPESKQGLLVWASRST